MKKEYKLISEMSDGQNKENLYSTKKEYEKKPEIKLSNSSSFFVQLVFPIMIVKNSLKG